MKVDLGKYQGHNLHGSSEGTGFPYRLIPHGSATNSFYSVIHKVAEEFM